MTELAAVSKSEIKCRSESCSEVLKPHCNPPHVSEAAPGQIFFFLFPALSLLKVELEDNFADEAVKNSALQVEDSYNSKIPQHSLFHLYQRTCLPVCHLFSHMGES